MPRRRQVAVLVLAFILALPWVAAAEPRTEIRDQVEPRVSGISEVLSQAWSLLQSLWDAATADCGDEGPRADPLGCPAQPNTDAGAYIDPLG